MAAAGRQLMQVLEGGLGGQGIRDYGANLDSSLPLVDARWRGRCFFDLEVTFVLGSSAGFGGGHGPHLHVGISSAGPIILCLPGW